MRETHILIAAGGTGGHVYPALAVADYLRDMGVAITWIGTRSGIESRIVPDARIPLEFIRINGLRGNGLLGWIISPVKLLVAIISAMKICLKIKPDAVLGMGGFVSGPCGLAAWLLNKPLYIHEQNAIPGLTNRILSRLADKVMEAFPGSFKESKKVILTGNPVRRDITELKKYANEKNNKHVNILVMGGSLGAQALNESVPAALSELVNINNIAVWHQSGKGKLSATEEFYANNGVTAKVTEYIDDVAKAYAWADLVICRSGALTISELANAGKASVLVPYPYAVDDHQTRNAHYLSDNHAAILISQNELTGKLPGVLQYLLVEGKKEIAVMAKNAIELAKPNATKEVAKICLGNTYE